MFGGANAKKKELITLWGNEICLQTCNMQIPNDFCLVGGHSGGHGHFSKFGSRKDKGIFAICHYVLAFGTRSSSH